MAALGFSILFLGASNLCRAQIEQSTMILNGKLTVDAAGNGHLEADIKFNPPRIYDRIKRAYPNLYVLFRDLIANDRASSEIDRSKTKINADDGTQTISFAASASGVAVNRSGKWQIPLAQGESLVTSEGNKVITSLVSATQNGMILNGEPSAQLRPVERNRRQRKECGPARDRSGDPLPQERDVCGLQALCRSRGRQRTLLGRQDGGQEHRHGPHA
jgi:hypothetical protein